MSKQIAIKGHATRGKEIIKLLEMLGANRLGYKDTFVGFYYYIECGAICSSDEYPTYSTIFTLEEFEEKYPHKVGDEVISNDTKNDVSTIVSMKWDDCLCTIVYYIESTRGLHNRYYFAYELKPYKEKTMEKTMEELKELLIGFTKDSDGNLVLNTHKDYEIKEIDGKFKLILKKPQYPKTYKECCEELMGKTDFQDYSLLLTKLSTKINEANKISPEPPHITLINNFYKLLICRDAYWKIAGEQMGLGELWKPKHEYDEEIFFIYCDRVNGINKGQGFPTDNFCLVFPTKEMRDAFYENFKKLINDCKELL